ncbi:endothelial zinc finger protein induced by tumor necrosis factor alpha-like isoform X2 [Nerophis ophidion]|uniref:endothelial zinc finger protein induced by tumor necrosis factor alpha-like isoform X2 n=1 Tax=Nerophis ophidion TaxID=159077 RepID=UPI002ADF0ED8|nr:endothelial zinc finger protein induced by tumor necrosis factor alpha-like isoform X2 [Nerophis ophidion]
MATSGKRETERKSKTSSKSPTEIKTRTADEDEPLEFSNNAISKAIVNPEKSVEEKLADSVEECKQRAAMIVSLKKAMQSKSEEMQECKSQMKKLQEQNERLCKENNDLRAEMLGRSKRCAVCEEKTGPHVDTNLQRIGDIQQLIGCPDKLPPQSPRGSSVLKEKVPQPPHVKEEEEAAITQEGECLLEPLEADLTKLPLTVVSVKTEDDEEKPQPNKSLSDVQRLIGHPEELSTQSGGSPTLKQETPQPPRIKKEEEEGECLLGPPEPDLTKFPLTVVSVKTEDDEEKPQPCNLLAPLSHSEAEDEIEVTLSSDTDCEGDMRTHTECSKMKTVKKGFRCSVCAKSFTEKSNLTRHMRTHPGKKTLNCSFCSKSFTQQSILTAHMRAHKGEKIFIYSVKNKNCKCSVCSKSFNNKYSLTRHMRTHTGERPFTCSVCGKSFSLNKHLTEHMRTHTGEKPFSCSVCGERFSQTSNLSTHMRTHTGEKPYTCSVCGKTFSLKGNMTQHIRRHTGEKNVHCSVCCKSFTTNCYLIRHMKTHAGPKPFSSSESHSQTSDVTQDLRKRTGAKTFNCIVCGRSFTKLIDFIQHMRKYTGEKIFNCPVCGKRFHHNSEADRHIRTHTGV